MPKPPKPKAKGLTTSSTKIKAKEEVVQSALSYEEYIQPPIEGLDLSSLELEKKSIKSDIAVDIAAFEVKPKAKPKQRKYSWWEVSPIFPPNTEVDVLHSFSEPLSDTPTSIWLSGYQVYDPDARRVKEPKIQEDGTRPIGICLGRMEGRVIFYNQSRLRAHKEGTPHYSILWRSR